MGTDASEEFRRLAEGIRRCTACPLHESRTNPVPGEGDPAARAVLIGEAPGEAEDRTGRPFCGRAGTFFEEVLDEVGIPRESLFVTSSVKCRPPGNRNPRRDEMAICGELWLDRQIELLGPDIVVLLGRMAIRQMLGETDPLREIHGQVRESDGLRWLLTYHPAAGMRFPEPAAGIREDFLKLAAFLDADAGGG